MRSRQEPRISERPCTSTQILEKKLSMRQSTPCPHLVSVCRCWVQLSRRPTASCRRFSFMCLACGPLVLLIRRPIFQPTHSIGRSDRSNQIRTEEAGRGERCPCSYPPICASLSCRSCTPPPLPLAVRLLASVCLVCLVVSVARQFLSCSFHEAI